MERPLAGCQYPRSLGEFQAWFSTDADCLDYLEWLRWPQGFVCPGCGHGGGWWLGDGRVRCAACGARTSPTAGTIFDRTRTPLTVWFTACWLFATQKDGISAMSLQRSLEIGSYQTAWAMLHRVRSVLVRPGRERLHGTVEVDETYIGGDEPGLIGGRAKGKKALVGVAVERLEPRGFGRCRMALLADGSADSLRAFLLDSVQPGATVVTDGWQRYRPATRELYIHDRVAGAAGRQASKLLPGVHKVSSLAKRWLLGTHQGAIDEAHLASYLNEFVFRFNRRRSRSRGLVFYRVLQLAVAHEPVRYRDLIANPRPGARPPHPPPTTPGQPSQHATTSRRTPLENQPVRLDGYPTGTLSSRREGGGDDLRLPSHPPSSVPVVTEIDAIEPLRLPAVPALPAAAVDRLPRGELGVPELDEDPYWRLVAAFLVECRRQQTRRAYFPGSTVWGLTSGMK